MRKWLLMVAVALVAGMLTGCGEKGKEVKAVSDIDLVKNYVFPWDKGRTFESCVEKGSKRERVGLGMVDKPIKWERLDKDGRKIVRVKYEKSPAYGPMMNRQSYIDVAINLDGTCSPVEGKFGPHHFLWDAQRERWNDGRMWVEVL